MCKGKTYTSWFVINRTVPVHNYSVKVWLESSNKNSWMDGTSPDEADEASHDDHDLQSTKVFSDDTAFSDTWSNDEQRNRWLIYNVNTIIIMLHPKYPCHQTMNEANKGVFREKNE